ncbi:hypothetical protein CPB86DRAFT_869979 [Serendipita vermifera]|nr:hypothetical protein CPB86DRAFT_869979 [Serendipita vermifera]
MPIETTQNNAKYSAKPFGLGRESKRPGEPLDVTSETTVWEIYNHKASEVDREMIKDWSDNLNTLLIFTALYSAVLTAFIIESMKLLEEDPAETTRDILLVVSRQLANSSFPAFEPTTYEAPRFAIIVNGLFFTSLSCALIAALLAVLALQWVANYDMGLNTSSPEKRALQRHTRFRGVEKWKMPELIASLPLLIFVALFLFFIGIADWLWHMNRAISAIVIGGIGIGFLLYTITNLISIVTVDAPFRTPISKELARVTRWAAKWLHRAITNFSSTIRRSNLSDRHTEHTMEQPLTFTRLEEKIFDGKGKDDIALDGLLWLSTHIETSSASRDIFVTLIKGFTNVPASLLMDERKIKDAPWSAVFEMLCTPYIGKNEYDSDELERATWICKGMSIIPSFESQTFERFLGQLRNSKDGLMVGIASFAGYKQMDGHTLPWQRREQIATALKWTNKSISRIGYNYLHFMLLNAKKEWPNMSRSERAGLLESMARAWTIPSYVIRNGSSPLVLPTESIELILDLAIPRVKVDTIEARYLAATRPTRDQEWNRRWGNALYRVLPLMTQQLSIQISHKFDSFSDFTKELELFSSLMGAMPLWLLEEKHNFIWVVLNKYKRNEDLDRIANVLCWGLYSKPFELAWVDLTLALDHFITQLSPYHHVYIRAIRFIGNLLDFRRYIDESIGFDALSQVRDPCIAWIMSRHCPPDTQIETLIHPNFGSWNEVIEHEITLLIRYDVACPQNPARSDTQITFLRAIILDGPSNTRTTVLRGLNRVEWRLSHDEKWHRLIASPVLNVILEQSLTGEKFPISSLLTRMVIFPWFHEEFCQANGLDWLPQIAIYIEDWWYNGRPLTEILVDQILFSAANRDIYAPLSSSYLYLQSVGQTSPQSNKKQNHDQLFNLRATLFWVLDNSINVHDSQNRRESSPPVFDPPILRRYSWLTVGDVRSFEFIQDMSGEEWEDWVTKLEVMIMGTSLGGLKSGPLQDRNRFCRDPDGCCGRI